jgi:sulfide:quinone oxidoreductase
VVSRRPLWSPPGKLAGRYLAPLLATARPPALTQLQDT